QAPQRAAALANDAADQVAESLTPFPSEAAWMPNAMARQALPVGDMELVACCDDAFAVQTRSLLEAVASLKGKGLADGVTVQFGWSVLTLRRRGDELLVCEPDFDGDPFRDF